jgi:glycosyltransferase involved in cell wall biosynthesis
MGLGITRFVAVSRALAAEVQSQHLLIPARTVVIHNGIDSARFRNTAKAGIRERLALRQNTRLVLAVGNLHPAKSYDVLLRAVALLEQDVHVVIVGNTKEPLLGELVALARSLGVNDRVHFLGFVADTAPLFQDANVYALSSSSEGFSISTLEALASRLPIVATRCGGPEEIVIDGETALLVTPGDSEGLAQAIDRLLIEPRTADRLCNAGLRLMGQAYDIERMVDGYESLYQCDLSMRNL